MATKKYVSLERLQQYDELLKAKVAEDIADSLQSAKDYADGLADNYDAAGSASTALEQAKAHTTEQIQALDVTDTAVAGQYVSAVSETDGKIKVTRASLPNYDTVYAPLSVESKVNTLIGSDSNKSVRTIASEELAAQLVADGAAESLDTLAEIAAWIQAHPDDAAAMNESIDAIEKQLSGINAGEGTVKALIDTKVDKVSGKSLIADSEITRLAGMSDGANKVEASTTNGKIKIDGVETTVYTHPTSHISSDISDFATAVANVKVKSAIAADSATKATQDGSGNVITSTYAKKATTLSGYGITDAYTKTATDSAISTAITNYDATLVEVTEAEVAAMFA